MSVPASATLDLNPTLKRTLTPASLIIGNLVPLFGVLLWDWDVGAIVMLYWAENLVIGAITIIKMFVVQPLGAIFMSAFFLVHYGGFCAVHGMFAGSFFDIPMEDAFGGSWPFFLIFVEMLVQVVEAVFTQAPNAWLFGVLTIALSHFVSFIVHFMIRQERRDATLNSLMTAPYKRVIVLHIAIIAGGFLVLALDAPMLLLLVLVVLKIGFDVNVHMRSHNLL